MKELREYNSPDQANQNNVAVGCHLLGFLGLVVPFGHILGPLFLWLIQREGRPFVDDQGREAVNFQISFTLWAIIGGALFFLLIWTVIVPILVFIGFIVLGIVWLVCTILAAVRASRGDAYRYPWTLRLLS
ncbi:MAG: DUF4870 domain-containing protein [Salinisphaera sp.]|nr:DUF4870 domain-containing protein [Salinisphaera sp.]MDN5937780.1 DUF4870 domain-containing protein [Salinisphaera sp.]